ncbi:hypothetical protein AURDEDRAFT_111185 [Auricularia subglabra TFB-10046 SS5]|nr:hypothetical protein AURDEDRAFT_111185 [Auricularia subglabra TFB-10046 SS5]
MSAAGFPVPQSAPATANPNSYAFEQPYVFGGGGYGGRRGSVQIDDTSDLPLETVFRVDPSRAPESARPPSSAVMPAPFPVKKLPRASRRRRTATTDAVVILPADPPPAPTFRDPAHAEEADPTPAIESLYLGAMQEKEALKEMDYQHSAWQLALGDPVARCVSPAMQLSLLYWFAHFGGKGKLTPTVRGAYADCAQAIHERSVRRARRFGSRNGAPLSSSSSTKA